jgi:hypothetical protein
LELIPENGGSPAANRLNHILMGWKRSWPKKRRENAAGDHFREGRRER